MEITKSQLNQFDQVGFFKMDRVISRKGFQEIRERMEDITQGRIQYPGMSFQLDGSSKAYDSVPRGGGFQGPSDNYRKIQGWEKDPVFLKYMQHKIFRDLTQKLIGDKVSIYRAMFMNKPPQSGTNLPYHQDGGAGWGLSSYLANQFVTVWTAIDNAYVESGCIQVVPGSHKLGLLSDQGHTITEEQVKEYASEEKSAYLEAQMGEIFVLHNFLLHKSGINQTNKPRRGFSVCYMDATITRVNTSEDTGVINPNYEFPIMFGENAMKAAV